MKKAGIIASLILVIIPLFLPWFNYNTKVTTGCWGYFFLLELLLPIVLIVIATLMGRKYSRFSRFVGVIGSALYLAVMVLAIGLWNQKTNVLSGFKWDCSIDTYMWGYWVSIICIISFIAVFIFSTRRKHD